MEELKFEKLSEVEVVEEPSEESHVLIVEGGEVKQAPKGAVGGAKEEWDVVASCMYGTIAGVSGNYMHDAVIEVGDYETLKAKINSGQPINGIVKITDTTDYNAPHISRIVQSGVEKDDYVVVLGFPHYGNGISRIEIVPDSVEVV